VVILGKPNVGKSTLFNALSKGDNAIVTEIPGTTRDALETRVEVQGIPVWLTDTAGIRHTDGKIEAIGIEKSKKAFENADFSLFVVDGSQELTEEDRDIAAMLHAGKKVALVLNKADLPKKTNLKQAEALFPHFIATIATSAASEEGAKQVEDMLAALLWEGRIGAERHALVTKEQHRSLLKAALAELREAKEALEKEAAPEFLEINIRAAYELLGEIIGEVVTDEILERVFEEFCVGK